MGSRVVAVMRAEKGCRNAVPKWRCVTAVGLLAALSFALTLAVSPQLHERVHKNAAQAEHECAVTLIASGKYEHSAALPLIVLPEPATYFAKLPALNSIWVAAPFLGASIFEHAPPALS